MFTGMLHFHLRRMFSCYDVSTGVSSFVVKEMTTLLAKSRGI